MDFFLAKINCCEKKTENSIMFCYCVKKQFNPFFSASFFCLCVFEPIFVFGTEKKKMNQSTICILEAKNIYEYIERGLCV